MWLAKDVVDNELSHMENNVPLHDGIVAMAGKAAQAEKLMPAHVRRAGQLAQLIPRLA